MASASTQRRAWHSCTRIILHQKTVLSIAVNNPSDLNCFKFDDIKDKVAFDDQHPVAESF